MGQWIHVGLVVGVPLLEVGELDWQETSIDLVSPTGRKTGERRKLVEVFIEFPNGNKYLVGSNEKYISRSDIIDFHYEEMVGVIDDSPEESGYFHYSGYVDMGRPESVILGVSAAPDVDLEYDRFEAYRSASFDDVEKYKTEAKALLNDKFGYTGEVRVIALARD